MASCPCAAGSAFERRTPYESLDPSSGPHAVDSANGESQYELAYGAQGTRVAIVASEPITGCPSDWVAVPKNTALVISREKKEDGFLNIMKAPLDANGQLRSHEEVSRCGDLPLARVRQGTVGPLKACAQDDELCLRRFQKTLTVVSNRTSIKWSYCQYQ